METPERDETPTPDQPFWMKHLGKICIGLFLFLSLLVAIINAVLDSRERAEILEQLTNQETVVVTPSPSSTITRSPSPSPSTTPTATPTETSSPTATTEAPSPTATETNEGDNLFTDDVSMMKWVDENTTPCANWDTSKEETMSVGTCNEDSPEEVTIAYDTSPTGIEEIITRLNGSTSEYHDVLYLHGNHWLIISPSVDLMAKVSVAADAPIRVFGAE